MVNKVGKSSALQRLISLLDAGYIIRIQNFSDNKNNLSLEHQSNWKRVKEKILFLHEDGEILGLTKNDDGTYLLIDAGDDKAFEHLISSTPRPTWWDKKKQPIYDFLALVFTILIFILGFKITFFVIDLLKPFWAE